MKDLAEIKGGSVLIIGPPASGKTTLANELESVGDWDRVIHTDDYMPFGYKAALYELLADLKKIPGKNILIEGVLGYRLLRKGVELDCYYPDMVIELQLSRSKQIEIYAAERDPNKLKYLEGFDRMHQKILMDYRTLVFEKEIDFPNWIKIELNR